MFSFLNIFNCLTETGRGSVDADESVKKSNRDNVNKTNFNN